MTLWIFVITFIVIWLMFFRSKKSTSRKINNKNNRITETCLQHSTGTLTHHTTNALHLIHDDELATFTLINRKLVAYSSSREPLPKTTAQRNTLPARWVKPGEKITIQNIVIDKGNFYYGGQFKKHSYGEYGTLHNDGSDDSLVNDQLTVVPASRNYYDKSLAYWPSYSTLSPDCRGVYLNWLAGNRNDAECPIGYVFIYFYGLERRILVDGTQDIISNNEFKALFEEIFRLRTLFQSNSSFQGYATRLLEIMIILRPQIFADYPVNENFSSEGSLLFRFNLATVVDKGQPVPADLALAWLHYFPDYSLRTPARRCYSEFVALFRIRYQQKYGEGIIVKPNKTRLNLNYTPASNTLRGMLINKQIDLPDPSVLKTPLQKLIPVAESCILALEPYSRYLGRKNSAKSDIAAIMLLPEEIVTEEATQLVTNFRRWADEQIRDHSGLAKVTDFWGTLNMPVPDKINKKEAEMMQKFATWAGYGIAPDMRYHMTRPEAKGYLVLFPEGYPESYELSAEYISVTVALQFSVIIAQVDKLINVAEQTALERTIDSKRILSPVERRSLHAYLIWLLHTPASQTRLKGKIDQLNNKQKSAIGNTVIHTACADGKIGPTEIKQLEKIYTLLGLDNSSISSDIHQLSTIATPLTTPLSSTPQTNNTFSLDEGMLARHESDTTDVRQLLNTIFTEDDLTDESSVEMSSCSDSGLDDAHNLLYQHLKGKEQWPRHEVVELCQQFNLMLSGAIETINNWSFDQVDAPVLDDNDDIYVDLEIVQELEG